MKQTKSSLIIRDYLSLQPLVETAGDHASGVGLDGDHRPQTVPEGPPHQEAPAAALEARDSLTGHVIRRAQLPGANQSLQAGEARSHLGGQKQKEKRLRTLGLDAHSCFYFFTLILQLNVTVA